MTRHRLTVHLNETNQLDVEVLNYLADQPTDKSRADILRSLVRAGFMVMVRRESNDFARLAGLGEETLRCLMDLLLTDTARQDAPAGQMARQRRTAQGKEKRKAPPDRIPDRVDVVPSRQKDETVIAPMAKTLAVDEPAQQAVVSITKKVMDDLDDFNPLANLQNLSESE